MMTAIIAKTIRIVGETLYILTLFRNFSITRCDIIKFNIKRIPSFFDEIGIELHCDKTYLVTERVSGFLDLAEFLHAEEIFGSSWYSEAENGRELESVSMHKPPP